MEYLRDRFDDRIVGNAFIDVPLNVARIPIYKSRFTSANGFAKETLKLHCQTLMSIMPKQAEKYIHEFGDVLDLDDFERASFLDLATFHKICMSDDNLTHYADAFHFWTAERNDIDYFCMVEKKFGNYVDSQRKAGRVGMRCQVVTPEKLLARLGVTELVPLPLQHGWFYHFGGAAEQIYPLPRNRQGWWRRLTTGRAGRPRPR